MLMPLLLVAVFHQNPTLQTDCMAAVSRGATQAAVHVCAAEEALLKAQAVEKGTPEWLRHVQAAAASSKRALSLAGDDAVKTAVVERLLTIYGVPMLDDESEMLAAFGELIRLKPTELPPLFRLARYQESKGAFDAAEDTLQSARRLQPLHVEPFQMLARFYARRASAMHAAERKLEVKEQTPPGSPDRNGVYQVGGSVSAPRRFGNAAYPPEATAAGIEGAVVAEILVDENGLVADAVVVKSNPVLDEAALKAVREWRYDPTIVDGRPVPVRLTVTVNFTLHR